MKNILTTIIITIMLTTTAFSFNRPQVDKARALFDYFEMKNSEISQMALRNGKASRFNLSADDNSNDVIYLPFQARDKWAFEVIQVVDRTHVMIMQLWSKGGVQVNGTIMIVKHSPSLIFVEGQKITAPIIKKKNNTVVFEDIYSRERVVMYGYLLDDDDKNIELKIAELFKFVLQYRKYCDNLSLAACLKG